MDSCVSDFSRMSIPHNIYSEDVVLVLNHTQSLALQQRKKLWDNVFIFFAYRSLSQELKVSQCIISQLRFGLSRRSS